MPFHWGSCLFMVVKEANLFSCSAFLLFSFTVKLFLFSFAILLICLSQLKLLVCDSIFYALFCAFLVQHSNTPLYSMPVHIRISFWYGIFLICDHKEPRALILVIVKSSILACEESINYNLKLLLWCRHGFCSLSCFLIQRDFQRHRKEMRKSLVLCNLTASEGVDFSVFQELVQM